MRLVLIISSFFQMRKLRDEGSNNSPEASKLSQGFYPGSWVQSPWYVYMTKALFSFKFLFYSKVSSVLPLPKSIPHSYIYTSFKGMLYRVTEEYGIKKNKNIQQFTEVFQVCISVKIFQFAYIIYFGWSLSISHSYKRPAFIIAQKWENSKVVLLTLTRKKFKYSCTLWDRIIATDVY